MEVFAGLIPPSRKITGWLIIGLDRISPKVTSWLAGAAARMCTHSYWIDGLAMMVFFIVAATAIELAAGIDLKTSIDTRLMFWYKPLLLGGLFGYWRDLWFAKIEIKEFHNQYRGRAARALRLAERWLAELIMLAVLKAPLYTLTLWVNGAPWNKIITATLIAGLGLVVVIIPFSLYFDATRRGGFMKWLRRISYRWRLRWIHRHLWLWDYRIKK